MKRINIFFFHLVIIVGLLFSSSAFTQIALNGIVDVNDYEGSQPWLINGVSSVPATGSPLIRHVYMASQNVIVIIVDEKACILSNLKPYSKQKNDTIVMAGFHGLTKLLIRKGDTLGYINGRENKMYRPFNEIAGEGFDLEWVSEPSNFLISSPDDPDYRNDTHPVNIFRKSQPNKSVSRLNINLKSQSSKRHYIYLKMPADLSPGKHYQVSFINYSGSFQKDISFLFDDRELRSESIHVNLYGYEPGDKKIAFLSSWMGDGGALQYPEGRRFRVVNLNNDQTVYNGRLKLKQSAVEPEYVIDGQAYNHNLTDVYEMDFSLLDDTGNFKLVVDSIGCSFDFLIDDHIWENTSRLLMKGFFHQRAGIEMGPPYTDYIRPRNLHPEDGHIIHKCDPEKFFNTKGGHFAAIKASILEETSIPQAWGGWMDAGDFDRRMSHFYSVRRMMYLYELNPDYFEQLNFNIPESHNNIPDILDEALWCLDLFRRIQGVYEEGAISWWIESIEHPRQGEASWTNSLPTALVPPTPEACIDYAGTAAQMARLLKKYDKILAAKYQESALDAMEWVENNPDAPVLSRADASIKRGGRGNIKNFAYLNLYRLTGEEEWHQRFKESLTGMFPEGINEQLTVRGTDVAAVYALMDPSQVDQELQKDCREAVITLANELVEGAGEVTYDILRLKDRPLPQLATMDSKILPVVIAHKLTGDNKYKNALTKTIQYTMGLNPMNRSYISGLGERSFVPYHHDWHTDNLHIPAGLPNFGPSFLPEGSESDDWMGPYIIMLENNYGLYPAKLNEWPMPEACFNQMWMAAFNEFMVEFPMGELLMLSGYLASDKK